MSVGSMNVSQGFQSDGGGSTKSGGPKVDSILADINTGARSGSSGGIEDLQNWLKFESNSKYDSALTKLGLDVTKIQGKHLVSYSLDEL